MINEYFTKFENTINQVEDIISSQINKKKANEFLGIIEGRLEFEHGILDILEVIKVSPNFQYQKKKYKYHFRKHNNDLIFRYDNAPHHKHITNFPHHKHIINNEIIESEEPNIEQILSEIKMIK